MTQETRHYGMTRDERDQQSTGMREVWESYSRRDRDVAEWSINLDAEEVDLLGQAIVALHDRLDLAAGIGTLLGGTPIGTEKVQKAKTLHYRLAKLRYYLGGAKDEDDPDSQWEADEEVPQEEAPQVIEGYANPDGSGEGNHAEEVSAPDPVSPTAEELEAGALDR